MVSKDWTVEIAGTSYHYTRIEFTQTHPSEYPDTFNVTIPKKKTTINWFDYVELKKNDNLRFYGYVEQIKYDYDENGIYTYISGRCRKVIVWKKWTERFTDTRIGGFFGKAYPEDLIKLLIRCPTSEVPTGTETWDDFPRQKIGWGLDSSSWYCSANENATGTHPIYPKLRLVGFYWRNRGTPSTLTTDTPDGTDGTMQWNEQGAVQENCINTDDGDTTYIWEQGITEYTYNYSFSDLPATASGINSAKLYIKLRKVTGWFGWAYEVKIEVYDGTGWATIAYLIGNNTSYETAIIDVTSILDTVTKVNAAKVRFTKFDGTNCEVRITYVRLITDYSESGTQEIGDYYKIDLGSSISRVCGAILQSRYSTDQYARTYRIDILDEELSIVDYTTFTEVDPNTHIGFSGTNHLDFDAYRNETAYIVLDKGDDFFLEDFLTHVDFKCGDPAHAGGALEICFCPWMISNTGDENIKSQEDNNREFIAVGVRYDPAGAGTYYISVYCQDSAGNKIWDSYNVGAAWNAATWYYLKIKRENETVTVDIYSSSALRDAGGAGDIDTLIIDVEAGAMNGAKTYRYVYGCNTYNDGGADNVDGDIENEAIEWWMTQCNKSGNEAQDIICSWSPSTVMKIRAVIIGDDTSHAWEITQVYVYQSDDADYTILESTKSPNIVFYSENSLILKMPFNEGSGSIAYDNSDGSNFNHGTINGPLWADGKFGNCLEFDGLNDYVNCGPVQNSFDTITLSAWIYLRSVGNHVILAKDVDGNPNHATFNFNIDGNSNVRWAARIGAVWKDFNGSITLSQDTWHHVVVVYDGTTMIIYVDGVRDPNDFSATGAIQGTANHDVYIGIREGGSWGPTDGFIDEVRIYNRALSQCEIYALYYENSPYTTIQPINMPYQRLNEAMEQIRMSGFDTSYDLWEWWIEMNDGKIYWNSRKGSDKSATISFVTGTNLRHSSLSQVIKQTAQRVRVTGKASGRAQDEVTSPFYEDTTVMDNINTFYEEIIAERMISDYITAKEWAQVHLNLLKNIVYEIDVDVESDTATWANNANSWYVGDDVTITDGNTGLTGSYRIKKIHMVIDEEGEHITLTVTNAWQDISDKIADIYKKIRQIQMSSTGIEDWMAEGADQGKLRQDKMENYWEMQREYDEGNDFQDVATDDQQSYTTVPAGFATGANNEYVTVSKDEMSLYGPTTAGAGIRSQIYLISRTFSWELEPRFMCKLVISGEFKNDPNNDVCWFGCYDIANEFGFQIEYDGSTYTVSAYKEDDGDGATEVTRVMRTIQPDILYEFEAKVDWNDRLVFFYIRDPEGNECQAVIRLNENATTGKSMYPMIATLDANQPASPSGQAIVDFYVWRSQAKKREN